MQHHTSCKKKNIFLSGEKGTGKSTIINKLLEEQNIRAGGFKTLPYFSEGEISGYYIQNMIKQDGFSKDKLITGKPFHGKWEPATQTFEKLGVQILSESIGMHPSLILMDELGFLESSAYAFQQSVLSCLESDIPVLGVIKPMHTPFLDLIRLHKDVEVLELTPLNREEIYYLVSKRIREVLCLCKIEQNFD